MSFKRLLSAGILFSTAASAASECVELATTKTDPKSAAYHLAIGLQKRERATDWNDRKQGELEVARGLWEAGAPRAAHAAYSSILKDEEASLDTRRSALACVNRIETNWPALHGSAELMPESFRDVLKSSPTDGATFELKRYLEALDERSPDAPKLAAMLLQDHPASPEARLARAFEFARNKKPLDAYRLLQEILGGSGLPRHLERHRNSLRLLAARSAFAIGQPLEAARLLRELDKSSNLAPLALEELSWALLEGERPGEAIGTAIQLERGLMSRTFTPEAPMVLAMALNELCQFPAALKSITRFRKRWQPVHAWMEDWKANPRPLRDLSRGLVRGEKDAGIPAILGWELIRSPRYLSPESLRSQILGESGKYSTLRRTIQEEQVVLAKRILESSTALTGKIRTELSREGARLQASTEAELRGLREKWLLYRALRKASVAVNRVAAASSRQGPRLIAAIDQQLERDLQRRLLRMRTRLGEVTENLSLVEIEILDGASRDLVWQNAHPELAQQARAQAQKRSERAAKTWNWGSAWTVLDTDSDSAGEVWEDELGSHEVLVTDRCEIQERQMAMKGNQP